MEELYGNMEELYGKMEESLSIQLSIKSVTHNRWTTFSLFYLFMYKSL